MVVGMREKWNQFALKHRAISEFIVFFMVSNGVTVLQLILMPVCKELLGRTPLIDIGFQVGRIGTNFDGTPYYIFNYAAGAIGTGGGGLAYFAAVQITMAVAQVVNFFIQRKITFKSTGSVWRAAAWYVAAYLIITVGAAAAQGFYKAPVYRLFIEVWNMGKTGETLADIVTMMINCVISFWVFFPILKIIFREKGK
ncbi:MAG: hypothetical protein HDR26_03410 [Lachnospiraceae bacterium]|nr:hypothetical protein [Lachnospiraceae bacterium]